jgi:hypothetical protein
MINGFWQCTKKWGLRYDQSKCKSNQVPVIYGMTLNAHFSLHEREWDVIKSEDRGQRTEDGPDMETTRDNNSVYGKTGGESEENVEERVWTTEFFDPELKDFTELCFFFLYEVKVCEMCCERI